MRIYWLDDLTSGCAQVRAILPAQELVRRGHTCTVKALGPFKLDPAEWDALVVGRAGAGDVSVLLELKRRGVKIIYDIDDALDLLEPDNLLYSNFAASTEFYFRLLSFVDLVTVTTQELANHVRTFAPDGTKIVVLPNCVREDAWRLREGGNAIPRIGFAGAHSHLRNIVALLDAITRLQRNGLRDKFEFVIFGFSSMHDSFGHLYDSCMIANACRPHPILREAFETVRELLAQVSYRWERAVAVESYPERLAALNFDLGLCPLRQSDFNRFKSPLKAYEYAMVGTEVMCSRVKPYVGDLPGDLFSFVEHDSQRWQEAIGNWIVRFSGSDCAGRAESERRWVLESKSVERNGHLWEEALFSVIGN